jgi:hypothetical protein
MSDRKDEISGLFTRWLDRYSPPLSMRDNQRAQQDEVEALLRTVLKFAPALLYGDWVSSMLDRLSDQMKTRAWPTQNEIGAVCSNMRKEGAGSSKHRASGEISLEPHDIISRRMGKGEAVAEGWLYGRAACELIQQGLIDQETMTRYRSAAFFNRKNAYGEDKALAWEDERKAAHEAAKATMRDPRANTSAVIIPDKTAPTKGWAA